MLIDTSLIGASSEPQTFEATEEAVRRFMEATEDPALQSDTPISFAPPTFPTTFRGPYISGLMIDRSKMQVLHGEQEYHYTRPLRIGDHVTCTLRIVDIQARTGRSGSMTIMVTETTGVDSQQQPVFSARSIAIVRQK